MAIGFTAPIYGSKGEFRGVVATRVPFEYLQPIFEQEGRLRYGEIAYDWLLLDREGTVLSEKNRPSLLNGGPVKVDVPSHALAAAERDHPGFVQETHRRRGTPVVTGYARTRGYHNFHGFDWLVLFRLDRDQIYAPVDRLIWMVGGIGLLVILPLTGYGIWASWELGRERNDLVEARQELEESVAELGRSNADLQQFAYVASHDLQEPLRMVSSYTQLIARRYKGKLDADADEFIAFAVDGANRMQRLIQDLLAYSRVKTGGRQFEPTAMETVLKAALDNLTNAVKESHAIITHDPLPAVMGDEKQLAQLFQNLLSNARQIRRGTTAAAYTSPRSRPMVIGCFPCAITASESIRNMRSGFLSFSSDSTREKNTRGPASAWPFARRSSNAMADVSGWNPNAARERRFTSPCAMKNPPHRRRR
jgi:signal transduction histidine kinase